MIIQTLKSGDHIVTMNDLYGGESYIAYMYCVVCLVCDSSLVFISGTNRYFRHVVSQFGISTSFVDCTDLNALEAAIQSNTKVNVHLLYSVVLLLH